VNVLKVSIVTVSYNTALTIARCIHSVAGQRYKHIQHIIIDGASTDGTLRIIDDLKALVDIVVSEPDRGIYDAMNKGLARATGDIVGMLNADDVFTDEDAVGELVAAFLRSSSVIVYANLNYVKHDHRISRKWLSGAYEKGLFNKGWMPPHPTFYCRRFLYEEFGNYSLAFGTAADYELMLRFMHVHKIPAFYLERVLVNMYTGGVSNNSIVGRIKVLFFDWKAMQINDIKYPIIALSMKRLRKIKQFL